MGTKKAMRPAVNLKPVASHYAMPNERIIEFRSPPPFMGGGLISIRWDADTRRTRVEVYRIDANVDVLSPRKQSRPND